MTTDNPTAKFEKFMESKFEPMAERLLRRITKDVANRPLIANVGFVIMALLGLQSLSAATSLWALRGLYDLVPQSGVVFVFFALNIVVTAVSALGLYRAKAYGVYAVALAAIFDVVTAVTTGTLNLMNAIICGILFYFLWQERVKFSPPSLPDKE